MQVKVVSEILIFIPLLVKSLFSFSSHCQTVVDRAMYFLCYVSHPINIIRFRLCEKAN